jgi:hypothetical protein
MIAALLGTPVAALADAPAPPAVAGNQPFAPSDSLLRQYRSHVEFLANPFLEGRGPGTRGNDIAAAYLEDYFRRAGLTPAFPGAGEAGPGFRQAFTAGNKTALIRSTLGTAPDRRDEPFVHGVDYSVLGISASAEVTAPMVFVGYGIAKGGPDGAYTSFAGLPEGDRPLAGKIAVLFRFEPMGEDGRSLWRQGGDGAWTSAAAIAEKLRAVIDRGAAGVILVAPPGCVDPRAGRLEPTEGTARWMRTLDVPAIMMTAEAADRLIAGRDPQRRGLMQLRRMSDTTPEAVELAGGPVTIAARLDRSPRTTSNVAGVIPGRGPLADEFVVVGAHYDHVGYGYTGGSRSDEYGVVHPGADDNASGTAGLLLIASELSRRASASAADRRSVLVIGFSAEEMGLIGAREFVRLGLLPAGKTYAMVNLDMIGRLRDGRVEISGTGTGEGLEAIVSGAVAAAGLEGKLSPGGRGPSDHAAFYAAGVPVLHLFTGLHEEYHTPRDTVETINFEGGARVSMLGAEIVDALATRAGSMAFVSTDRGRPGRDGAGPAPTMGAVRVRFGISPGNYADGEAGVAVGEVMAGTAAEEAGIKAGDRLIRWNGKEIADVQGWMELLSQHKPGDVVDVGIKRAGEETTVRVTLKSRDQAPR